MTIRNIVPDDSMDVVPHSEAVLARARQVVAANASDAAECAMFLAMLSIDGQPEREPGKCRVCGGDLAPVPARTTTFKRGCCSKKCVAKLPPLVS